MYRYAKDDVFGMANISPKRSNLPCTIWAQNQGVKRNVEHNAPYVKISYGDSEVSVSISENPEILTKSHVPKSDMRRIESWIDYVKRNYDLFLKHFNDEDGSFDDMDLFEALKDRGELR